MKLVILTIALDAMPMITWHLPTFNRLPFDWQWLIAEGVADNILDTSWCRKLEPRLSNDGTTDYLGQIQMHHPRVDVFRNTLWPGKTAMFNKLLEHVPDECLLLQVDADEIWTIEQLSKLVRLFEAHTHMHAARFFCRYFVGQNIVTTTEDAYGNNPGEWLRCWRYRKGMQFKTHEPPVLDDPAVFRDSKIFTRQEMREYKLVFDHYAYAYESQLRFKEQYYGYENAVLQWRALQANTIWPAKLKQFLPWVDDRASADLVFKP